MADLTLIDQKTESDSIKLKTDSLKQLLEARLPFWQKISKVDKKTWIDGRKDPVVTQAYDLWEYLNNFFGARQHYE